MLKQYEDSGSFGERLSRKFEGKMDQLMLCPECNSAAINMNADGSCQCRSCKHKYNGTKETDEGVTKDKPWTVSRVDGPGRETKMGNNFASKAEAEAYIKTLPVGPEYEAAYQV